MTPKEHHAMLNGFYDELDKIAMQQEMAKEASVFFEKVGKRLSKKASVVDAVKPYVTHPAVKHFAMGALPGAAIGAVTAEKGERTKGALKGGAVGGAVGLAGGHIYHRAKRDMGAAERAAKRVGFDVKDFGKQDPKTKEKFHRLSHIYRKNTPIYQQAKTAAKKDDGWDRPSDSVWQKHKGKILAGSLALATAAGLHQGRKKYVKIKWQKGRAKVKDLTKTIDHQAQKRVKAEMAHPRKGVGSKRTEVIVMPRTWHRKGSASTELHRRVEADLRKVKTIDPDAKFGKKDYVFHSYNPHKDNAS